MLRRCGSGDAAAEQRSSGEQFRDFEKAAVVAVVVTSRQDSGSSGSGFQNFVAVPTSIMCLCRYVTSIW